jgi:hypothetical protein
VRPARKADNSAVLAVPNVAIGMEIQHTIHLLNLRNLIRENVYLYVISVFCTKPYDSSFGPETCN